MVKIRLNPNFRSSYLIILFLAIILIIKWPENILQSIIALLFTTLAFLIVVNLQQQKNQQSLHTENHIPNNGLWKLLKIIYLGSMFIFTLLVILFNITSYKTILSLTVVISGLYVLAYYILSTHIVKINQINDYHIKNKKFYHEYELMLLSLRATMTDAEIKTELDELLSVLKYSTKESTERTLEYETLIKFLTEDLFSEVTLYNRKKHLENFEQIKELFKIRNIAGRN